MRKVLCVSPHFPPVNSADMHRLRLALPYFKQNGWLPTILTVKPEFVELSIDQDLMVGLSDYSNIVYVNALSQKWTRKIGLGNLGLRSLPFLLAGGGRLLKTESYDLIYFSTTVFDCMILGRYWKKKFGVPFVIDMHDPWRNDYHLLKDQASRPSKYWFDHRLKSITERWTVPSASGITSVTQQYIDMLKTRYPIICDVPMLELTFGADERDFDVLLWKEINNPIFSKRKNKVNIVYTGAVPDSMTSILEEIFSALRNSKDIANHVEFHFVGTNYAIGDKVVDRVLPSAKKYGVENIVREYAKRLPYFQTLRVMKDADILLLPGTMDQNYTASKLYPYILSKRPIIGVFNESSNVTHILNRLNSAKLVTFRNDDELGVIGEKFVHALRGMLSQLPFTPKTNWDEFEPYTALEMTRKLCGFFDKVLVSVKE